MNPHLIMQRIQRTLLGLGCITGGCAALVGMLSTLSGTPLSFSFFESSASATEAPASIPVATTSEADKPTELKIAPQERVVIPPGRPEWVEADYTHEKSDTQKVAISSGPFKRKHDAVRGLDEELVSATSHFVADYLGSETAATLVPVDINTIRRDLMPGSNHVYHEQIEIAELGPMWQSHALLEFTPGFKQQLDERWRKIVVAGRLAKFGVISVGMLMALSVVLGYFKADTATRGYYTTRLQVGTAGAMLALVAGAVMLLRYI